MKALIFFLVGFVLAVSNPGLQEFYIWADESSFETVIIQGNAPAKPFVSANVKRTNCYIFSIYQMRHSYYIGILGRFFKFPQLLDEYALISVGSWIEEKESQYGSR